jgi:hypothetical protein
MIHHKALGETKEESVRGQIPRNRTWSPVAGAMHAIAGSSSSALSRVASGTFARWSSPVHDCDTTVCGRQEYVVEVSGHEGASLDVRSSAK